MTYINQLHGVTGESRTLKIDRATGSGRWAEHIEYMKENARTNDSGVHGLKMTDTKEANCLAASVRGAIKRGTLSGYRMRQSKEWVYLIREAAVCK